MFLFMGALPSPRTAYSVLSNAGESR
jgi:hypothetical protein